MTMTKILNLSHSTQQLLYSQPVINKIDPGSAIPMSAIPIISTDNRCCKQGEISKNIVPLPSSPRSSLILNFLKGAIAHMILSGLLTGGETLKILSNSILQFEVPPVNRQLLKEIIETTMNDASQRSWWQTKWLDRVWYKIDPETILTAKCPKEEFYKLAAKMQSAAYNKPFDFLNFNETVATPAVVEELIFRGVIQDLLLKKLVHKVIKRVAPAHANIIDSKIYTVCRIAITSVLFSSIHLGNMGSLPDDYVYSQVIGSFIMGLWFGAIKERWGLAGSIAAHAMQNLTAILSAGAASC